MSNGEIERLPVSQLIERYDLARSAVYTRLDALGIKPEKIGNKSFVNGDQLSLLDELHEFIQSGRTTAEFLEMRGMPRTRENSSGLSSGLSTTPSDLIPLMGAFAAEIASRLQSNSLPADPLAYFKNLELAAQNGWILKTSEIAELLDLSPSEILLYGDRFSEAGFIFTRNGYRQGEVAWIVSKPIK